MTGIPDLSTPAATATSVATAAAAGAVFGGMPPPDVIAWSLIGGVVAVWLDRRADIVVTPHWLINSLMLIGVSAAAGIALSAAVLALAQAQAFAWIAPLQHIPHWSLAGVIAGVVHKLGPLGLAALRSRVAARRHPNAGNEPGGPHAS